MGDDTRPGQALGPTRPIYGSRVGAPWHDGAEGRFSLSSDVQARPRKVSKASLSKGHGHLALILASSAKLAVADAPRSLIEEFEDTARGPAPHPLRASSPIL